MMLSVQAKWELLKQPGGQQLMDEWAAVVAEHSVCTAMLLMSPPVVAVTGAVEVAVEVTVAVAGQASC